MIITKDNTKVVNCYKYTYKEISKLDIIKLRKDKGYSSNRSPLSYTCEIKVHKFLYHLGYKKSHTIDADLEENIDKKLELLYIIIGGIL